MEATCWLLLSHFSECYLPSDRQSNERVGGDGAVRYDRNSVGLIYQVSPVDNRTTESSRTPSHCHTGTRSHQCEIRILILHGSVPPTQAAIPSDIWLWWDHYEYWWKFYILWFPSWCWWLVRPNKLMMNNRWLILACCELNIIRNVGIFLLRSALFLNH